MSTLVRLLLIFCLVFSAGCAARGGEGLFVSDPALSLVWPLPPDTPRIRYFRTINGPEDFRREGRPSRLMRWVVGEGEAELPLRAPYGVTADGEGRVWAADPEAHAVHVFDLAERQADYLLTAGEQMLVSPVGLAYDSERQWLYVSDTGLNQVFVLDRQGRLLGTRDPGEDFSRPAGMALDSSGRLYVADALRGRVEVFSPEGEHLRSFGEGTLYRPANLAVDPAGQVYVVDSLNFRIVVFTPEGDVRATLGAIGDGPGSFARPRGVAVDSQGHIYVSDAAFDNIQIFDMAGNLLLFWGGVGKEPGKFNMPAGLFFDGEDRLYVADMYNRRIQIFEYLPQP